MEKLRMVVNEIAYARDHAKLPTLHRSLIPFLAFASSLYSFLLPLRGCLYRFGVFRQHRLPVPVISVGNLTWGGNGKTPMVEYIAKYFVDSGLSPLVLTRGYAGGDEAKMLERHLLGGPAKIGIGANRAATAALFLEKYGYMDPRGIKKHFDQPYLHEATGNQTNSEEIVAAILDDGMQHWSLYRDLEIVMVNGLNPWGNCSILPFGPLREPLKALGRADIAVVHHADLATEQSLRDVELRIQEIRNSIPIFYTRMAPKYLFDVKNTGSNMPLEALSKTIVLCVSAIGCAEAFVKSIGRIGACYVDRLEFSDHHLLEAEDIEVIRRILQELERKFNSKPVVVVTEKDYDRDPDILKRLDSYQVLVLCSELQVLPHGGTAGDDFKSMLKRALAANVRLRELTMISQL